MLWPDARFSAISVFVCRLLLFVMILVTTQILHPKPRHEYASVSTSDWITYRFSFATTLHIALGKYSHGLRLRAKKSGERSRPRHSSHIRCYEAEGMSFMILEALS